MSSNRPKYRRDDDYDFADDFSAAPAPPPPQQRSRYDSPSAAGYGDSRPSQRDGRRAAPGSDLDDDSRVMRGAPRGGAGVGRSKPDRGFAADEEDFAPPLRSRTEPMGRYEGESRSGGGSRPTLPKQSSRNPRYDRSDTDSDGRTNKRDRKPSRRLDPEVDPDDTLVGAGGRRRGAGGAAPDRRRGGGDDYDDPPAPRGGEGRRRERDVYGDELEPSSRRRERARPASNEPDSRSRRDKGRDPYDEPSGPIRMRDNERPRRVDDYLDDDTVVAPIPRSSRRRDEDDDPRRGDSGYRSDGRDRRGGGGGGGGAAERRRDDRGYRSDGRDRKRSTRDGDGYGYDSDRGPSRAERSTRGASGRDGGGGGGGSGRSDRRDRYESDRSNDRRDRRSDRDPYRDSRPRSDDRSRERSSKKKSNTIGGFSLNAKDINRYVETGQKHYQTAKPIIDSLAKMYLSSK